MKNLLTYSNKAELDSNRYVLEKPSVVYTQEDKKVYFPSSYYFKLKYNGRFANHLFASGAYADGDDCYFISNNLDSELKNVCARTIYKFNSQNPAHPNLIYSGLTGSGDYNFELIFAGKTHFGDHMSLAWPTSKPHCGLIDGGTDNPWTAPEVVTNQLSLCGPDNEQLFISSKLMAYNGYTYFAAYDYSPEGMSSNQLVRCAFICRTADMQTFEVKPLLSMRKCSPGSSMKSRIKQISEPDMTINSDGHCYFVVRAVGDYESTDVSNANKGFYYGEIDDIEDYFTKPDEYPSWGEELGEPTVWDEYLSQMEPERVESLCFKNVQYVDTSAIAGGGHLKGVLPRIVYNHITQSPMVVLYGRTPG